jgi:beta-phosphoglucomutase
MIRGVIFDFDGVIVDSHRVHKRAWRKFLESVGKTVSEEELLFVLDGRKREDILRHFLGDLDPEQMMSYGHRKEQFFRDEARDVQPLDGLLGLLDDLLEAGVAVGVASSGSRGRVNFLLDRLDLKKHFQVVITGDEVENGKPDPSVFLKAAQALRKDPGELLAFEDAASGVQSAKAAGMKCIGIAQPDRASVLLDSGADHVLPDFCSLSYSKLQELFV